MSTPGSEANAADGVLDLGPLVELFGTPVSEGTVVAMSGRAAGLPTLRWPGSTRPGCGRKASRTGAHCARTDKYTVITCHPKRVKQAIDAAVVLARLSGVAVRDARDRATPPSTRHISCVARTRCASCKVSPTPHRRMPSGAGPSGSATRWSPCSS